MSQESPDWVGAALRQLVRELRLFLRTAIDFTLHPARFAGGWTSSGVHRLNPLGFAGTSFAMIASVGTAAERLFAPEQGTSSSLTADLFGWLLPFAYFFSLGVVQHAVLRVLGSTRRLRDSCAMSLYAGGGAAMALLLLAILVFVAVHRLGWPVDFEWRDLAWSWRARLLTLFSASSLIGFFLTLGVAQATLHESRGWKVVLASFAALIVSAFFFGMFHPPGTYGMHLSLAVHHLPEGWSFDVGLGT